MMRKSRHLLIVALIISSFLCGFTYKDLGRGGSMQSAVAALESLPATLISTISANLGGNKADLEPIETFASVFTYLDEKYYGDSKLDSTQLTYSAIRGMLASLGDRYTRFLDPDEYKQMQQDNRGNFTGIGAELDVKDGRIFIVEPIPNSPAERAGLKHGDIILKVDDQLIQSMDITKVVNMIRGDKGTQVRLTIKREEVPEPIEFTITRDVIPLTIVKWRMEDKLNKIGYIELRQFNENSDQQIDKALTELESQGMQGLILDLRRNPGGLLEVAVDIASRFVSKGNVVIIQNKGGRQVALPVDPSKHNNHHMYPLVVLINEGTASASEIVAGAIQDHKAGVLVGTDSFGKGLVQTIVNVDNCAVAITTAKYLTPSGRDVGKNKVHPDVVVEPTDEDRKNDNDVQLKRAVQILQEKLGSTQATTEGGKQKS